MLGRRRANHKHSAAALDNLAMNANFFDRGFDFHSELFIAKYNPALAQIIRAHLKSHAISR